jgi:hypothetical protein
MLIYYKLSNNPFVFIIRYAFCYVIAIAVEPLILSNGSVPGWTDI